MKKYDPNKIIVIEIACGCMDVTYTPKDIKFIIIDWDNFNGDGICPLCGEYLSGSSYCFECGMDWNLYKGLPLFSKKELLKSCGGNNFEENNIEDDIDMDSLGDKIR